MNNFLRIIVVILAVTFLPSCDDSDDVKSCESAFPVVTPGQLFFENSTRLLMEPELKVGISCHNCYDANSLENTFELIEAAIDDDVDVIELDMVQKNVPSTAPVFGHGGNAEGVSYQGLDFESVVEHELLTFAEQILFLEIKGEIKSKDHIRNIFNILKKQENQFGEMAYFNTQRFTVFRNLTNYDTLSLFRDVLDEAAFLDIKPFIKLSRIFGESTNNNFINGVLQSYQCGFHMVEFNHQIGVENISHLTTYAKLLGIGVNVFTLNEDNYEEITREIIHDVDVLTVDSKGEPIDTRDNESIFIRIRRLLRGS